MPDTLLDPSRLDACRTVAVELARRAGAIQREAYGRKVAVRLKGAIDLLTEVDQACEELVVKGLTEHFPEHGILAEEGGGHAADHPCEWIVDPLDGTTNFAHKFPFFCVSIGLVVAGAPTLGVVYAPMLDELFVARRGAGATLNGAPVAVSETDALVRAMLVTGFSYNVHQAADDNLDHFADFTRKARATRRTGSAALDLCYVACGRFDGFWEMGLKPWDVAAGALAVTEAGGAISRFDGSPHTLGGGQIVASNGRIHPLMVDTLMHPGKRG